MLSNLQAQRAEPHCVCFARFACGCNHSAVLEELDPAGNSFFPREVEFFGVLMPALAPNCLHKCKITHFEARGVGSELFRKKRKNRIEKRLSAKKPLKNLSLKAIFRHKTFLQTLHWEATSSLSFSAGHIAVKSPAAQKV
jgi:hypothetical protein